MPIEPPEELDELSEAIIGAAVEVHRALGPGLLESVYQEAFVLEMEEQGLAVEEEVAFPVRYKDRRLEGRYRVDMLVEDEIIVETKAVEGLTAAHEKQLLTYLSIADRRLGLLINFDEARLIDGIRRIVD